MVFEHQEGHKEVRKDQMAAIKMVPELNDQTFGDMLREMGLPTLRERIERVVLITLHKRVNGIKK